MNRHEWSFTSYTQVFPYGFMQNVQYPPHQIGKYLSSTVLILLEVWYRYVYSLYKWNRYNASDDIGFCLPVVRSRCEFLNKWPGDLTGGSQTVWGLRSLLNELGYNKRSVPLTINYNAMRSIIIFHSQFCFTHKMSVDQYDAWQCRSWSSFMCVHQVNMDYFYFFYLWLYCCMLLKQC